MASFKTKMTGFALTAWELAGDGDTIITSLGSAILGEAISHLILPKHDGDWKIVAANTLIDVAFFMILPVMEGRPIYNRIMAQRYAHGD